ncbi:hypothetical protein ElyMa_001714000 [Elysia marginata]|uniref:Uncharacterized protein n=1 Tax=Elysia marginata TaxID=1093978 RepID=A0AAV4JV66_9GAST|nr:hypothetical protein ElyMa_001714000 [Elysia marginata]
MTIPDAKAAGGNKPANIADLNTYMTSEQNLKQLEALGNFSSGKPASDGDGAVIKTGERHDTSWRFAFLHFAQITTLHGVRFVFLESGFVIRR